MAMRNELGFTLEGHRKRAEKRVRELTVFRAQLTLDDARDAWNCAGSPDWSAEDWMRREGFGKEADAEFGSAID